MSSLSPGTALLFFAGILVKVQSQTLWTPQRKKRAGGSVGGVGGEAADQRSNTQGILPESLRFAGVSPSSNPGEPDVSKSPDATQGPVTGAPRPSAPEDPVPGAFRCPRGGVLASARRAGRREHPRVALGCARAGGGGGGVGAERRTRAPEPLGAGARGGRRGERGLQCPPPGGRAQHGSPRPASAWETCAPLPLRRLTPC